MAAPIIWNKGPVDVERFTKELSGLLPATVMQDILCSYTDDINIKIIWYNGGVAEFVTVWDGGGEWEVVRYRLNSSIKYMTLG